MVLDLASNFGIGSLAAGINSTDTSLTLLSGEGVRFGSVPFNAVIWNATDWLDPAEAFWNGDAEVVRVTSIATDTLTITRAQESTGAVNLNAAGKTYRIVKGLTAKDFNAIRDFIG